MLNSYFLVSERSFYYANFSSSETILSS